MLTRNLLKQNDGFIDSNSLNFGYFGYVLQLIVYLLFAGIVLVVRWIMNDVLKFKVNKHISYLISSIAVTVLSSLIGGFYSANISEFLITVLLLFICTEIIAPVYSFIKKALLQVRFDK